jgi:hypothetical protein
MSTAIEKFFFGETSKARQSSESSRLSIRHVLFVALVARLIIILGFANLRSDYYWEYGEIGKNILLGKGFSYYSFSDNQLSGRASISADPFPSAYMAPGYVVFLVPFLVLSDVLVRNLLLFGFQTILSLMTVYLVFVSSRYLFSHRAALVAASAGALAPDVVYSVVSATPTVLYHLAVLILIIVFTVDRPPLRGIQFFFVIIIATMTIYLRSESIVFVFAFALTLLKKQKRNALLLIGGVFLLLGPWLVRNAVTFQRPLFLSTGSGLNFYRGNNPVAIGFQGDSALAKSILRMPRNNQFEVARNDLYFEHAFAFLASDPLTACKRIPEKLFHILVFSTLESRPMVAFYYASSAIVFGLFAIGITASRSWEKHKYFYLFIGCSVVIGLVFFALPRHQTLLRIGMLPFVGLGGDILLTWFLPKGKG